MSQSTEAKPDVYTTGETPEPRDFVKCVKASASLNRRSDGSSIIIRPGEEFEVLATDSERFQPRFGSCPAIMLSAHGLPWVNSTDFAMTARPVKPAPGDIKTALVRLLVAADHIRHQHDALNGEGFVVSAEHVRILWRERDSAREVLKQNDWHGAGFTYASDQATACAGCGEHKHTPLRRDHMGGYVCLTCIDKELDKLMDHLRANPEVKTDIGQTILERLQKFGDDIDSGNLQGYKVTRLRRTATGFDREQIPLGEIILETPVTEPTLVSEVTVGELAAQQWDKHANGPPRDGTRLNRRAMKRMLEENLVWLANQKRDLERDHIELILKEYIRVLNVDADEPIRPAATGEFTITVLPDFKMTGDVQGTNCAEWECQNCHRGWTCPAKPQWCYCTPASVPKDAPTESRLQVSTAAADQKGAAEIAALKKQVGKLECEVMVLAAERDLLKNAIITHRSQKADDRCIEDDDRLYEAVGDGVKCDRRVGDPAAMLQNCGRFIRNRCEAGGPWQSYADLEKEVARLKSQLSAIEILAKVF